MSNFGEIMQQAVRLRQATDSSLRSKFDNYPIYLQGTLFSGESDIIKQARSISTTTSEAASGFEKRLEIAETLKSEGNKLLSNVNRRTNWNKRGIKDEDISLDVYSSDSEAERERLKSFKVACYLNIALSYARQHKYNVAAEACGSALEIDPTCVKALFRRAQYISLPPSAGATEVNMAIRDLEKASSLAPSNREVRSLLLKLKGARHSQMIADKCTYSGLFERGSIVGQENTNTSGIKGKRQTEGGRSWSEYRQEIECNVTRLEEEAREAQSLGRPEEAERIRENHSQLQSWLNSADAEIEKCQQDQLIQRIDWRNPTSEAIADAKSDGIDLTDPLVIDMLEECEREARVDGKRRLGGQDEPQHLNEEEYEEGSDDDDCNDLEGLLKRIRKARHFELISICKHFNIAEERKGLWDEMSLNELRERVVAAVQKSVAVDDTGSGLLVGNYSRRLFTLAIVFIFIAWRIHALGLIDTKKYLYFI